MRSANLRRASLPVLLAIGALSCLARSDSTPGGIGSSGTRARDAAEGAGSARILMTQIPVGERRGDREPGGLPPGARVAAFDPTSDGISDLTPGFDAAGRPVVSFDGKRVLFVGRRAPEDPTGVWEMRIDGTGLREVVRPKGDCEAAIYLSTIFTLDAERPLDQIGFAMRDPRTGLASLYTSLRDGSNVRQITFAPHGVSDPLLLSDGRLLFSMTSDGHAPPSSTLFTVNTDGTDLFPFAGQHAPRVWRSDPCETDGGDVVYVESSRADDEDGGLLAAVSRTRSLTTRRAVAVESRWTYRSPSPLPNGHLIVSYRPGEQGSTFGLYELDPVRGRRVGVVFDDPDRHELDAVAVRSKTKPPGRSTVVNDAREGGQLNCLDAYLSDTREGRDLEEGAIARVRVIAAGAADSTGRVLGVAEVESDGSFFLEVPARTPLRLETLDESGAVLQAMESWIWVMPVERRGCIGCHEDREMAPPNRHVLALRKRPQAVGVEPREIESEHGGHSSEAPR